MNRRAPVYGVTKCPECRRFFITGDDVVTREVEEYPWRQSSSGHTYRSITPVKVRQRWHRACLERMERDVERLRLKGEFDQWNDVRVLCEESGLPVPGRVTEALAVIQAALDQLDNSSLR